MQDDDDIPMERLAAAMEKARSQRARASTDTVHSTPPRDTADPEPGVWSALAPIELSARTIERGRLGALQGPAAASSFDVMRTRVLRTMRDNGWTRLAITSPDPGSGKTTLSANLALSLARKPELRVILMDFDMRRPALARLLDYANPGNLVDLLSGHVDFGDFAVRYGQNLAIALNASPVAHSAELLQGDRTPDLLDDITARGQPDLMIFDMPPLMGPADTLSFLEHIDGVLLVAAAEHTTVSQIDVSERELSDVTNVIGTVLNKCRYPDAEGGYQDGYYY
jgi:protein-tyrosine kinase